MNEQLLEVQGSCSIAPISLFTRNLICMTIKSRTSAFQTKRAKFLIDFTILILPQLFAFTLCSHQWRTVAASLVVVSIFIILYNIKFSEICNKETLQQLMNTRVPPLHGFLSDCRAYILILTNVVILAVDFPAIFPDRFKKSDRYGSSLMDVGVGCFVLVGHGVISREARGRYDDVRSSLVILTNIKNALVSSAALLTLGVIRLVSTTLLNYRPDVIEYGIHWNFFFTLAAVKIFSTFFLHFIRPRYSWFLSLAFIASYEFALSYFSLRDYIFDGYTSSHDRVNIFDANREGIFSCVGYMSLYFAGVALGRFIFLVKRDTLRDWVTLLLHLGLVSVAVVVLLFLATTYCDQISRKIANLSFFMWMIAFNLIAMTQYLLTEIGLLVLISHDVTLRDANQQTTPDRQSTDMVCDTINPQFCLLRAVTYNGLLYFLLGNLLTGLVNLTFRTEHSDTVSSLLILIIYMFTVSGISALMYSYKITTKV